MSLPSTARSYSPKEIQAMEAPLIALAQASGGDLRKLFYAFFDFLHRRTDFYLVPNEMDRKEGRAQLGFAEGDAEKLLFSSFRQFPLRRIPRQQQQKRQEQQQPKKPQQQQGQSKFKEQTREKGEDSKSTSASGIADASLATNAPQTKTTSTIDGDKSKGNQNKSKHEEVIRYTETGLQIPIGNGGSTKRYKWTQTIDECTVLLPVAQGTRAKQLSVDIKASSISVKEGNKEEKKKGNSSTTEPTVYLEGALTEKIQPDESTWSLESDVLILILYKQKKTFWETVVVGDEKIDTSLVDSRRNIAEYDESTQGMIRKIIFDENQKRKGKPTSNELIGKEAKIDVPPLPPGVEYYDQSTIERIKKEQKK